MNNVFDDSLLCRISSVIYVINPACYLIHATYSTLGASHIADEKECGRIIEIHVGYILILINKPDNIYLYPHKSRIDTSAEK